MSRRAALALALAVGSAAALEAPVARAQSNVAFAQQRYERGVELYNARQYEAALQEFNASLALYESPNTLLFVGRSLRALGRLDEAVAAYGRAADAASELAARAPRYAPTADAARAEGEALLPQIGHVVLRAEGGGLPAGARVRVAGRELPAAAVGLAIPVMPGSVRVEVEAEGYAPWQAEVAVEAGGQREVRVGLVAGAAGRSGSESAAGVGAGAGAEGGGLRVGSVPAWAVLGVGTASFVAAGVLWAEALQQYHALEGQCPGGACSSDPSGAVQNGRALETWTNVALGVGVAGAVAGAALVVLTSGRRPARGPSAVGFDGRSVFVGGWF